MKLKLTLIMAVMVFTVHAQMRVHQINVGQGCATLIEFPCSAILIDSGGETNGLYNSSSALQSYLETFFERRTDLNYTLQAVYLTHPHKDHTLNVPVLLQAPYVIKNVITNGHEQGSGMAGQIKLHRLAQATENNPDPTSRIGLEAVRTQDIGSTGLTNSVIDPVNCTGINPEIKILWGALVTNPGWANSHFENENNHSLVIKITYGQSTLLIIGDLEDTAQNTLVAKYSSSTILDSDVYLVGHHGSKNGTTQELINKITPKIALIGVGDIRRETNWTAWAYGHPNKNILEILQANLTTTRTPFNIKAGTGAKTFVNYTITKGIYSTGWDDDIILETNGDKMWRKKDLASLSAAPESDIEAGITAVPLLNINTATADQLETLPGIGTTKAQAIVSYRTSNGPFQTIEKLDDVPGIGLATIDLIRPYAGI